MSRHVRFFMIIALLATLLHAAKGFAAGGFISGGGAGFAGCPVVEDCYFEVQKREPLWSNLQKVIADVNAHSPGMALEMTEVTQKWKWMGAKRDLDEMAAETIGIPMSRYQDVKTLALHLNHEVWIDEARFVQLNDRSQLLLLVHEVLVGIHFKQLSRSVIPGLDPLDRLRFKAGEALTPTQYQGVRNLTIDLVNRNWVGKDSQKFCDHVAILEFPRYRARPGETGYADGQEVAVDELLRLIANHARMGTIPRIGTIAGGGTAEESASRCRINAWPKGTPNATEGKVYLKMIPNQKEAEGRDIIIVPETATTFIRYSDLEGYSFDIAAKTERPQIQDMRYLMRVFFGPSNITQIRVYPQIYQNVGRLGQNPRLDWYTITEEVAVNICR